MDILVVGGAESLLAGAYGQKLAQHNIHVKWHEPRPSRLEVLPEAAEGVLIIKDMVSHALSGAAINLAKTKGIPFVQVTRKFSHAYPVLRDSGFLSSAKPLNPVVAPPATPAPAAPVVLPTTSASMASTPKETMPPQQEELTVAMDLIFKEDPYTTKKPEVVRQRLLELTRIPTTPENVSVLCKERQDYLKALAGRLRDPDKTLLREKLREQWLVSFCEDFFSTNGCLPKFREVNEEARQYFGSTIENSRVGVMLNKVREKLAPALAVSAMPEPSKPVGVTQPNPFSQPKIAAFDEMALRLDAMQTLLHKVLERQARLETHLAQLTQEVSLATESAAKLAPSPSLPQTTPMQFLADLVSHGLSLRIESK